jgi:hypothetical protein
MTLIHGPAGANSCPYRVPASCVASVSPVKRVFVIASGGAGIRTRSVASAYTSPNTGTGPTATPTQPSNSSVGKVEVSVNPSPVPFSGQPISDISSCQSRPNTWFYDQVLRETGGVAVTVTERVDSFDGAVTARSNPGLRIPANGSTTIRTRWCSSSSAAHTAQTNFNGTDANGRVWSVTGTTVRLLAK